MSVRDVLGDENPRRVRTWLAPSGRVTVQLHGQRRPRPPEEDCGCRPQRHGGMWRLVLCRRHTAEALA